MAQTNNHMDAVSAPYYRLAFEKAFLERKGTAFQDWFVNLASSAYGADFEIIRPYGKQGDWKCDGRRLSTGTYFQCYAPDAHTDSVTISKINDDFPGVLEKWGKAVKSWVFVHNDPRGVPPTVAARLDELRAEYPTIDIAIWLKVQLFVLFDLLSPVARDRLFGPAPTLRHISDLTMPDLKPIIDALEQHDPNPNEDLPPPPSAAKLEKNTLSEDVAALLRIGRRKVRLVEQYFARNASVELGERIASGFRSRYAELTSLDLTPDQTFGHLQEYAGMSGEPKRQVAALAVLAYFFDVCDIFEDPDALEQVT